MLEKKCSSCKTRRIEEHTMLDRVQCSLNIILSLLGEERGMSDTSSKKGNRPMYTGKLADANSELIGYISPWKNKKFSEVEEK